MITNTSSMTMMMMTAELSRLEKALKDALRRCENEKSRRLALEDSNAELTKEVRLLRSKLISREKG